MDLLSAVNVISLPAAPARAVVPLGTACTVVAIASTTDIAAVPAVFADVAAVCSYLAGSAVVPNIEIRLDTCESKINFLATAVTLAASKIDAVIAALKQAGLMTN